MSKIVEKFMKYVSPEPNSGCWIWTGCVHTNKSGQLYGYFRDGKMRRAQRVSYELFKGPITEPIIRHTCDVTLCVNPDHLIQGTQKENVRDRYVRHRDFHHRGISHRNSVLTDQLVIDIRKALDGGESQRSIAKQFGISQFGVRYARDGWEHV